MMKMELIEIVKKPEYRDILKKAVEVEQGRDWSAIPMVGPTVIYRLIL